MTGTYTLLVGLGGPATIRFGAAGPRDLDAGWFAYTGSALGPGGFARIDRHRRVAAGEHDVRHWHVDHLLGHTDAWIEAVERSVGIDAECRVAGDLAARPIPGIGATDCGCDTHLVQSRDRDRLWAAIERTHRTARGAQS